MNQYRLPSEEDKAKGLLYCGSRNIMVFSEKMIGLKPYSWQVYTLKDIQKAIFQRKEQYIKIKTSGGEHDGSIKIIIIISTGPQ